MTVDAACAGFVTWLDAQVTATGRGDGQERLEVRPADTFWLGRLACEDEVRTSDLGERAERLDPCAIGVRLRPAGPGPWTFQVTVGMRAWAKDDKKASPDPDRLWWRTGPVEASVSLTVPPDADARSGGRVELERRLAAAGAPGLSAEVRVEVERWRAHPELVVQLVNTTPGDEPVADTHLYETQLEVRGLDTHDFELEALPDSFRYDRSVPAYGVNVAVEVHGDGPTRTFRTSDSAVVETFRPTYWNSPLPAPDLSFDRLGTDPLPPLRQLVDAFSHYHEQEWSDAALDGRARRTGWTTVMREHAGEEAERAAEELHRLRRGLALLADRPLIRRSFQLMNRAIAFSAVGRGYTAWRPFQIGFLLSTLVFLDDPSAEAGVVDTVWFATGGGKTETYLGLLVTAAFHDRLTGKGSGVTAWSRFPLRLLSLQQTQRFADALAGAELVRREEGIGGAPFGLGFLVGRGGTPNRIVQQQTGDDPDPDSPGMPDRYQVLLHCPFCRSELGMRFDHRTWRLGHECRNRDCPWPEQLLPVYIVDQEVYRFLPTVVLGTLDKAASIGFQAAMRGLVGPPLGLCTIPGHGYTYAPRSKTPQGCLVPDCQGTRRALPMPRDRYAPSLRLQDELHLLRDSLGAVDAHYESLLDHLQEELGAPQAKVVASSATLTGYDRQVEVLYRREGRVFPLPGPAADASVWSAPTPAPLRRFVAVAPRGVTLEHVNDRTVDTLQKAVRRLTTDPGAVCAEAGIDPVHAPALLSLYGTDVVYGSTLYDVEAAERSIGSNSTIQGPVHTVQLTGQTDFDEVRAVLDRLDHPEPNFDDRIHVIAASSMLSHGVDIDRLNTMVMLGLPLSTAEFIQTTARVGRRYPGLVYVLHKIGRERDAQTFRHFPQFVRQGDRFVEPIPITRRSRRVLQLTLPGIVEARRLALAEPAAPGQRLTTLRMLRDHVRNTGSTPATEAGAIAGALGLDPTHDALLHEELLDWLDRWFTALEDPATSAKWPSELGPSSPMTSLRDVEAAAPIHD